MQEDEGGQKSAQLEAQGEQVLAYLSTSVLVASAAMGLFLFLRQKNSV